MKKKHKKMEGKEMGTRIFTPSLIGVSVFFVVPFGVIFYYSMVDSPIDPRFVFLRNFVNLFHNSAFFTGSKKYGCIQPDGSTSGGTAVAGYGDHSGAEYPIEKYIPNLLLNTAYGTDGFDRPDLAGVFSL